MSTRIGLIISLLWPLLLVGQTVRNSYGIQFETSRVPIYLPRKAPQKAILYFAYADSTVRNPASWAPNGKVRVKQVDLVYTAYPRDTAKWITPYNKLLFARIRALQTAVPELRQAGIKWRLVAQTNCTTAKLAKRYFHGAVITYEKEALQITIPKPLPKSPPTQTTIQTIPPPVVERKPPPVAPKPQQPPPELTPAVIDSLNKLRSIRMREMLIEMGMDQVKKVVEGKATVQDPVVMRTLEANKAAWSQMLLVVDWTASMYEYGAQIIRWYRAQQQKDAISHLAFFNDGNDYLKPANDRSGKVVGQTGGIYYCSNPDSVQQVLDTMQKVMRAGSGGEDEENDIEALLRAMQHFPQDSYGDVVLIADNASAYRDVDLLDSLTRPVHVILCGNHDVTFAQMYLTLAWRTGGSVSTLTQKIQFTQPREAIAASRRFIINDLPYVLIRNEFKQARN
jgi:hypothetical protein